MLSCLNAVAQQAHRDSEVMQLTLPKGTSKLSKEEYGRFMSKRYDKSNLSSFRDHVYKKDGLLIYYLNSAISSPKFKRSLESSQSIMLGVFKQYSKTIVIDTAKIITVNKVRFSIIKYHENNIWYTKFTSDYDKTLRFVNGFIEYKKADADNAQKALDGLLRSMHFKD
jgi:hypothetical protein